MTTYLAVKQTPTSNTVVKQLNARVLTSTFPGPGIHKADLYRGDYGCCTVQTLVAHGTCGPVDESFVETVLVKI